MNSVYFIKRTEQHAAQAPALRERNHPSKFCGSLLNRGSFVLNPEPFGPELMTEGKFLPVAEPMNLERRTVEA
jgi:hypothetical protein